MLAFIWPSGLPLALLVLLVGTAYQQQYVAGGSSWSTLFAVRGTDQTFINPFTKSLDGNPVRLTFDSKIECALVCSNDAVCSGFAFKTNGTTNVDCVFSQNLQSVSSSPGWILHAKARGKGTYKGCYRDSWDRILAGSGSLNYVTPMTIRSCVDHCIAAEHTLAAAENGDQCYCGSAFANQPPQLNDSACNTPCAGDSSQFCGGGSWAAAIYETGLL